MTSHANSQAWLDEIAATKFAESLGEIALSYLAWRPRMRHAEDLAASMMTSEPLPGEMVSATGEDLKSTFAGPDALKSEFVEAFLSAHRDWTKEDTEAAVTMAFAHCRCLTDWVDVLVRAYGIELEFDQDEPQVAIAKAAGWHALTNRFDPDAVVCYLMAKRGGAEDVENLSKWGVATRIGERDLSVILEEGVTDLHIHLGGVRSAQILWRNVMMRIIPVGRIRRYTSRSIEALSDPDAKAERIAERARIQSLVKALADDGDALGCRWSNVATPGPCGSDENKHRIDKAQRQERAMMTRAWKALIDLGRRDGPDSEAEDRWSRYRLEHQLDQYIYAKNIFLKEHCQPQTTNPGLGMFRSYYHATDPVWPRGRLAPARFELSARLKRREYAEYAAYIEQSRALRRVELRMAPLESPGAYQRFFKTWAKAEEEFGLDKRDVEIRFAIHFKRSLPPAKAPSVGSAAALRNFLRQLDRDSAMLHSYRSDLRWVEHSWRIARIDFAGQERDIPPDVASFCMNLARGDPEAIEALTAGGCDRELHRLWLLHAERGTASAALGRQGLGLTCHVGEDYARPLEGTYCVASAVKLLKMRAGDTIGHGLALGHSVSSFDRARSPRTLTVRGLQFDALLWLYLECQGQLAAGVSDKLVQLEPWLRREAHEIYGPAARRVQSMRNLERLFEQRCRPVAECRRRPSDPCARLRHLEIWDERCGERRGERVPVEAIVYELSPVIEWAQKRVLNHLAENGIALEFNPSSNLRISGSPAPADIPFMAILEDKRAEVLATINTDNPGTVGTRIENEYALVMRALHDARFTRAESLEIIGRLRDVGRRFVYWPRRPDKKLDSAAELTERQMEA